MRPGVQLSKVFYMPDVEQILTEFENAVDLNSGEEWRKGLHDKGKEAMADAARWEKWESQLLRGSDPAQMLREYDPDSFPGYMEDKRRSVNIHHQPPAVIEHGKSVENTYSLPVVVATKFLVSFLDSVAKRHGPRGIIHPSFTPRSPDAMMT